MLMERRTYAENNVRAMRKARGLSQEQLGLSMESQLTGSTIAKLETGRQALSVDYLLEMAKVLDCSTAELLHPDGQEVRWVPVIGHVEAGSWGEAVKSADRFMPVPSHLKGGNLYGLEPYGTSMDLVVPPGGTIVVNPDDTHLRDGRFYVIENSEHLTTFKKFSKDEMALMPCSSDPSHKPIPLGSEPFRVLGRVVFFGADL